MNGNTLSSTPTYHYPALFLTLLIVMYICCVSAVCVYICVQWSYTLHIQIYGSRISVLVVQVFEGSVSVIYDDSAQTVSIEASHVTVHLIT